MKVNRRNSYKVRLLPLPPHVFLDRARAEDAINVASIHDLSGGLDIYGKPMVDALTLPSRRPTQPAACSDGRSS